MATMLVVPVVRIGKVREHPNASMLGVAEVLGYQVVTGLVEDPSGPISRMFLKDKRDGKGKRIPVLRGVRDEGYDLLSPPCSGTETVLYFEDATNGGEKNYILDKSIVEEVRYSFAQKEGDLVVYFPADTVIPDEWVDRFGVRTLLKSGNRVGKINLRGEPSFGLVVRPPEGSDWKDGDNVASHYGAKKWEPPVKTTAGDAAPRDAEIDPYFDKFTDVQNGRIFVGVFRDGEDVVASEKIHGTNCRVGVINGHMVAGSMELRRSPPADLNFASSTYWFPWSLPSVVCLMNDLKGRDSVVELFGEVYGGSVQKGFRYDAGNGVAFRAFGIKVGDRFLDWEDFEAVCQHHGVPVVPVLYSGPLDLPRILSVIEGQTTLGDAPVMEGCVIVPARERIDPRVGRAVLKYISYQYELLKNKPDCKDV
jgi:RNA ligase (TIGR02306 family)